MQKKQNKKSILIADDEPNIRLLIRKAFENDYLIFEAGNGREAIKKASQCAPDIIILDVMMPEMDGFSALKMLKSQKRTSSIPVIIFTGAASDSNEKLAIRLGAQAYLRKPISPSDLSDTIKKMFT